MELMEVFGKEKWQNILDELSQKLGMSVTLQNMKPDVLLKSGETNGLCNAIREKKENRTFICAQTAQGMTAELKATRAPVNDFCEAGMKRFTIPVVRGGELLGQVTGCGIITDPDEVDIDMLAMQTGAAPSHLEALKNKVINLPEDTIGKAVTALNVLVNKTA